MTTKKTDVVLPRVPSALIELALADLLEVEKDKRYFVDMGSWHTPVGPRHAVPERVCFVCMAGAVMARTLGAAVNADIVPSDLGVNNRDQLNAIDHLRRGNLYLAFSVLGLMMPDKMPDHYFGMGKHPYYVRTSGTDRNAFFAGMKSMAAYLKGKGF